MSGAYTLGRLTFKAQFGFTETAPADDDHFLSAVGTDLALVEASKAYFYVSRLQGPDDRELTAGLGFEHRFSL